MFTGIIEAQAHIESVGEGRITLTRPSSFTDIRIGSSVSVAGVCLTVVELSDTHMTFDVVGETRAKSTLGQRTHGDAVNLERAMQATDRFEGHMVQGHIQGVGEVRTITKDGNWTTVHIRLPKELLSTVVTKGSISIDGVSLTVASVTGDECRIALIPQTLEYTTLGRLKAGDRVNIETDVLGRYIHSLARAA
ncbi:riboflavin synthase [Candidatus Peregrinibacteria bacterium CG10_big_fil_rev_8_21_14_0_10_49_10]|nr:MAG: riboflavin synthase [Candidatus Peregrinibacteria bacterium CG10_big_fil_rev_8_21_14_0_10_49_10]